MYFRPMCIPFRTTSRSKMGMGQNPVPPMNHHSLPKSLENHMVTIPKMAPTHNQMIVPSCPVPRLLASIFQRPSDEQTLVRRS